MNVKTIKTTNPETGNVCVKDLGRGINGSGNPVWVLITTVDRGPDKRQINTMSYFTTEAEALAYMEA